MTALFMLTALIVGGAIGFGLGVIWARDLPVDGFELDPWWTEEFHRPAPTPKDETERHKRRVQEAASAGGKGHLGLGRDESKRVFMRHGKRLLWEKDQS